MDQLHKLAPFWSWDPAQETISSFETGILELVWQLMLTSYLMQVRHCKNVVVFRQKSSENANFRWHKCDTTSLLLTA